MSNDTELKKLEGFVSKLLQSFQDLKEENGRLIQELQVRDETIVNLNEQLNAKEIEKDEIGSRVNGIIDKIEEWEINLGEEVFDVNPPSDASRQGSLFGSVDTQSDDDTTVTEDREESRVNEY
ncbi:hypothetical protein [Desulfosediminicola flagellatus]|uniref:hypothetical protein n=1 Tax=Desulfosediminicola flagellatus TaxID=2569541 RepID=UPI0010AC35AD|nr:hypothetical protein [Desulfosediminicola flagellatus]